MKPRLSDDPLHRAGLWQPRWIGEIPWRYSRTEVRVDGIVHALGILFAIAAWTVFAWMPPAGAQGMAVGLYLATLAMCLTVSAAYNLWPVSRSKWILRRFDHSAIYLLIAGTYTPFMVRLGAGWLLAAVWGIAAFGVVLKLWRAGRGDTWSIALYLALGWSGLVVCRTLIATLPTTSLWLIAAGGLVYSAGVVFHIWERLPFQNAVWHAFVLVGATLHFGAVWSTVAGD